MNVLRYALPRLALAVYLCAVAVLVFQPTPELAVGSTTRVTNWLLFQGAPAHLVNEFRVEFLLNTIMLVPLPILGSLVWPRVRFSDWVVVAFLFSMSIEITQGLLFDSRSAQFVDVVSNTLGGLIGGTLGLLAKSVLGYRRPVLGRGSRARFGAS